MKKAFQKHNLLLTSSFIVEANDLATEQEFYKCFQYFDFIHILQPPIFGNEFSRAIQYALGELDSINIQQNIDHLIDSIMAWKIPPTRIVLGLNFCGPWLSNDTEEITPHTPIAGYITYNDICDVMERSPEYKISHDHTNELMLLKDHKNQFIIYRNTRSMANLVKFAVERNLAGIFAYTIEWDNFEENCKTDDDTFHDFKGVHNRKIEGKYIMMQTISEALSLAVQEVIQDVKDTQKNPSVVLPVSNKPESCNEESSEEESSKEPNENGPNENEPNESKPDANDPNGAVDVEVIQITINEVGKHESNSGCAFYVPRHSLGMAFVLINILYSLVLMSIEWL